MNVYVDEHPVEPCENLFVDRSECFGKGNIILHRKNGLIIDLTLYPIHQMGYVLKDKFWNVLVGLFFSYNYSLGLIGSSIDISNEVTILKMISLSISALWKIIFAGPQHFAVKIARCLRHVAIWNDGDDKAMSYCNSFRHIHFTPLIKKLNLALIAAVGSLKLPRT